jgi:hypothetical protein
MTRRNFFRSALACFGAMVLAPVRGAGWLPKPVDPKGAISIRFASEGDRIRLIGSWNGEVFCSRVLTKQEEDTDFGALVADLGMRGMKGTINFV